MVLLVSSLSLDEDLALEGLDKGLAAKVLSMELDLLCLANFNMIDQFKPAKNKGILRNMWFCDYNHLFACLDVNATHVCVCLLSKAIIWLPLWVLCFNYNVKFRYGE